MRRANPSSKPLCRLHHPHAPDAVDLLGADQHGKVFLQYVTRQASLEEPDAPLVSRIWCCYHPDRAVHPKSTPMSSSCAMGGAGWGVSIAMTVAFIATVELWKALARRGRWPWLARISGGQRGLERRQAKKQQQQKSIAA